MLQRFKGMPNFEWVDEVVRMQATYNPGPQCHIRCKYPDMLKERLATSDINEVKADALPLIRNPKVLDI